MEATDFKFSTEARQTIVRVLRLDDPGDPEGNHDSIIEEIEGWVALYRANLKAERGRPGADVWTTLA